MSSVSRLFKKGLAGLLPWLLPIFILLLWELSARFGWLSNRILPEPLAVLRAAWSLALSGELWTHVQVSAARAFIGFAIGGGLGLVLGLLTGTFRSAEIALDTTLDRKSVV